MTERGDDGCALCGDQEWLFLDHDHEIGQWAVRGVLCHTCNVRIGQAGNPTNSAHQEYLNRPWWKTLLSYHGVAGPDLPEPPIGTTLRIWESHWTRSAKGWINTHKTAAKGTPKSWWWMLHRHGPHNLRADLGDSLTRALANLERESARYRRRSTTPLDLHEAIIAAFRAGARPVDVARRSPYDRNYNIQVRAAAGISGIRKSAKS